jgi:hypothetical protein
MIFFNGEIVNVHLNSGEDIIGAVTGSVSGIYTIKRPVVPNVMLDPATNNFRVGLLPLRPYLGNVEEVSIDESKVAYALECPEQMTKLYHEFTSNIYLASANELPKGKITL